MEDRIQRCAEKFGILFGAAPAGDEGTDPEFMKILQRFIFGEVCYMGELSDADRELVTVTVQLPAATPVIRPRPSTVATLGSEEVQISPLSAASAGVMVTMGIWLWPRFRVTA